MNIKGLIILRYLSIPVDTLLIAFPKYACELREFCGFKIVPDCSNFTYFKQNFLIYLQKVFVNLVDITDPIFQAITDFKNSMTVFNTLNVETFVVKNNSEIK